MGEDCHRSCREVGMGRTGSGGGISGESADRTRQSPTEEAERREIDSVKRLENAFGEMGLAPLEAIVSFFIVR